MTPRADPPRADPVEALGNLWSKGQPPDLAAFLLEVGPLPAAHLAAVARLDQRRRWQAHKIDKAIPVVSAETYLEQFPALQADAELAVDLIFNEFLLRDQSGQAPELEEYLRRFPAHQSVLKDQIGLYRALAAQQTEANSTASGERSADEPTSPAADDDGAPPLPEVFGRYRIVQRLGQGGMGTVYLAHDSQLQRQVALKAPRSLGDEGSEVVQRFYREARAAAGFHHRHLCPVYDVGAIGGIHYFTMPVLKGESLAAWLQRAGPLPQAVACRLARVMAQAMQVAHEAGVVHRDLKPSNIMIQDGTEPVVMDFGLARRGGLAPGFQDPRLTSTGLVVGTGAYMPPEQIAGSPADIGPAADVYSLGVILYEMLTGQPPFRGALHEILRAVLTEPPPPPRQLRADLDPAVETICLKALAKKPAERFSSMVEFAAALGPFARTAKLGDSDTIRTHRKPEEAGREPARPPRKKRAALFAGVALAVVLLGVWLWTIVFPSSGGPEQPDPPGPPDKQVGKTGPPRKAGAPTVLKGHAGTIRALAFNPQNEAQLASGADDGFIHVWDVESGKHRALKGNPGPVLAVAFHPGGKQLASAGGDEEKLVWDVLLWDVADERSTAALKGHSYLVSSVTFSPAGKLLASAAGDNTVRLWDVDKGEQSALLEGHTIWVRSVAFHPKGKTLASGSDDETVRIWDVATGKGAVLRGHERSVLAVAFSPDGQTLASASEDRTIKFWDVPTGKNTATLEGHTGVVTAVAFNHDGTRLVSGGADSTVKLWDVATRKNTATREGHKGEVRAVAFSPTGRTVAYGGDEHTILLWDLP